MQVTETVEIAAPPERVWQVLTDVEAWPTWTDSVRAARLLDGAPLAEGSRVELRQPRLPTTVWVVTELVDGSSFSWSARGPGVVSVADHRLEPGDGGTRVRLEFSQQGPLGTALGVVAGGLVRRYVGMEAAGLKRRCEQPSAA
jgi:uncharacterized protein YndB with AHSA1/START domain